MSTPNEQTNTFNELEKEGIELFKAYLKDLLKFRTKGTASAAVRARKNLSTLARLTKDIRKTIQQDKVQKVAEKRAAKVAVTSL